MRDYDDIIAAFCTWLEARGLYYRCGVIYTDHGTRVKGDRK
jgi:hypothetical protein